MNFSDIAQAFVVGAILSGLICGALGFAGGVFTVLRSFERMDRQAE
jgi:hypothetical protein